MSTLNLVQAKKKIKQNLFRYKQAKETLRSEKKELAQTKNHLGNIITAQTILQELAQAIQQNVHEQVAKTVTRCLQAVFDDPYELHINFEKKRSKTEAKITFTRNGIKFDPLSECGGGVVDVAAFALRLAALLLDQKQKRKVLILDEPFRFVSKEYRGRLRELLLELAKEGRIQFIIITHDPEFQIGNTIIQLPMDTPQS